MFEKICFSSGRYPLFGCRFRLDPDRPDEAQQFGRDWEFWTRPSVWRSSNVRKCALSRAGNARQDPASRCDEDAARIGERLESPLTMVFAHPGGAPVLSHLPFDQLRSRLCGRLITPADANYETSRETWNRLYDPCPRAVVRCESASDVIAAVRFAREYDLEHSS